MELTMQWEKLKGFDRYVTVLEGWKEIQEARRDLSFLIKPKLETVPKPTKICQLCNVNPCSLKYCKGCRRYAERLYQRLYKRSKRLTLRYGGVNLCERCGVRECVKKYCAECRVEENRIYMREYYWRKKKSEAHGETSSELAGTGR